MTTTTKESILNLALEPHTDAPRRERAAFTVDEFCDAYRVSRTTLYLLWRTGKGPKFYYCGTQKRISVPAAYAWQRGLEAGA
jgi:hypothetical protein